MTHYKYRQSIIFALLFFIIALIFRACAVYRAQLELGPITLIVSCLEAWVVAGIGFYIGQLKSKEILLVKHLTFSALLAFLMSHTISNLAGLYQLSWFTYAISILIMSAVIAVRAPKMFNKTEPSTVD